MISPDSLLLKAKLDIYHRLLGDELLADVSILVDDEGDLNRRAEVEAGAKNTRNGKTGACIIVAAVGVVSVQQTGTPTPMMNIAVEIEVIEDVLVNTGADGTGINAAAIVGRLVQSLHQSHYDDRFTGLKLSSESPISEMATARPGLRAYLVTFTASDCAFEWVDNVASVACSVAGGEATLTCATSGATIYYTLDGTYPGSGNAAAQVYSAPFAVEAGDQIRAAAQKTGANPSKNVLIYAVSA